MGDNQNTQTETTQAVTTSEPAKEAATSSSMSIEEKLAKVRGQEFKKPEVKANDAPNGIKASETATGSEGEKKQVETNREKPNRTAQRFGEYARKLKEKDAQIADLLKRLEGTKPTKTRDEYENDEAYIADISKSEAKREVYNEQLRAAQEEKQHAFRQSWEDRVSESVKDKQKFSELASRYAPIISKNDPDTEEYVLQSPVGPRMLEMIMEQFQSPGMAESFFAMPKAKKALTLVRIEELASQVEAAQEKPVPQPVAPTPTIAPAKGDKVTAGSGSPIENKLAAIRARMRGV